jgi:hypothetical protein
MLFRERVAVYCENHADHTDKLRGQNVGFQYVEAGGTHSIALWVKYRPKYKIHVTLYKVQ